MNKVNGLFCILGMITCVISLVLGHAVYADSLVGNGINLKIKGNYASGTLILNGKYYTTPGLTMSTKTGLIQLVGNVAGASQAYLMTTGIPTQGIVYQFNGMIQVNGKASPVSFTASLISDAKTTSNAASGQSSGAAKQPTGTTSKQTGISSQSAGTTVKQAPTLPMLMLPAQPNYVYVEHFYNLAVKIFDPKANPTKTFDQFNGGISGVNINAVILDQNNQPFGKLSGTTDSKGLYEGNLYMSYSAPKQQQMKVIINATKTGYASQQVTLPFQLIHVNYN